MTIDDRSNEIKFQEILEIAKKTMQRLQIPGFQIGLLVGDQEFISGLGVTSLENPLPVTADTIFRIGSTTKTMTATALFRLIERGMLALDDRVRKYIPNFKVKDEAVAGRVTIRQLLNHTSGWLGDYFLNTGDGDDALEKYVAKMAEVPQLTPLGALYTYNNAAVNVAGRVIEILMGKPYETAVRELVLDPLGMSSSFFSAGEVMLRRFVVGHVTSEDRVIVARPWVENRSDAACGGLVCDVHDMLTYARFHMGIVASPEGERLLTPESLKIMQTPSVKAGAEGWVGLNWFIEDKGGVSILGHGGSSNGQIADFWFAPQQKVALALLTNHGNGGILNNEINQWVQEHFLGVVETKPVPIHWADDRLAEYSGRYVMAASGDLFTFAPLDGGLLMTHQVGDRSAFTDVPPESLPPIHCVFYAPDEFIMLDEPLNGFKGEFLRDAHGRIAWLRFGGRVFARV
jgi:CubicO group peptidase (beta-lactamase class C family)